MTEELNVEETEEVEKHPVLPEVVEVIPEPQNNAHGGTPRPWRTRENLEKKVKALLIDKYDENDIDAYFEMANWTTILGPLWDHHIYEQQSIMHLKIFAERELMGPLPIEEK